MNFSVTKLAACRSPSVALATKTLRTQLKAVSLSQNGVISDLDAMYSPGQSRKKQATIIILIYAIRRGYPEAVAILDTWRINWRGTGLN